MSSIDINKLRAKPTSKGLNVQELRIAVEEDGKGGIDLEEIHELLDRLEAVEKERDALCAKIKKMEKQEPVVTLHDDGYFTWVASRPYESDFAGWRMKVYALPGAKGEEK